jgi:nickel/cobalt transporter (NiCoT) family protein
MVCNTPNNRTLPSNNHKDQLNLTGGFWDLISLNDHFGTLGFVIIGVFVLSWVGSVMVYRVKGFDRLGTTTTD